MKERFRIIPIPDEVNGACYVQKRALFGIWRTVMARGMYIDNKRRFCSSKDAEEYIRMSM